MPPFLPSTIASKYISLSKNIDPCARVRCPIWEGLKLTTLQLHQVFAPISDTRGRREKISWRQNIRDTYSRRRCRWVCTGSSRRGRGCRRGRTRPASTGSPRSCSPRGTAASPGRQSRHVSGVWRCLEWSVPTKIIKTSRISKQKVILFPSQPPSPRPTVLYLVWGLWTV